MKGKKVSWVLTAMGILLALAALYGMRMMSIPQMVPPSKEIVYDDFGFGAPTGYSTRALAGITAPKGQAFYVIEAKISNYAKRVTYLYRPEIVFAYTVDGEALERANAARDAMVKEGKLKELREVNLNTGESGVQTFVFVGPAGQKQLRIGFSTAGWFGNMLDNVFGGNENILLYVPER